MIEDDTPIGLSFGNVYNEPIFERAHLYPHILWFPWANSRQKLSGVAHLINDLSKTFLVLAAISHKNKPFFNFLSNAGFGKRIGTPEGWFRRGDKSALYQSWSD